MARSSNRFRTTKSRDKQIIIGDGVKVSQKNHDLLVEHIKSRLLFAKPMRDMLVSKITEIDIQVAAYIEPSDDDLKRLEDTLDGDPKASKVNTPLTDAKLQDAAETVLTILSHEPEIYHAVGNVAEQNVIDSFNRLMNQHANEYSHERQLLKFAYNATKYNFAALVDHWSKKTQPFLQQNSQEPLNLANDQITTSGQSILNIDMYNFLWDPAVSPVDLPDKGEFFAIPEVITSFRALKGVADGELFNGEGFKTSTDNITALPWYRVKPQISSIIGDSNSGSGGKNRAQDWTYILSGGTQTEHGKIAGHELVHFWGWIVPKDFGMPSTTYEIWKFILTNNNTIVYAERQKNIHSELPISVTMPREDDFELQTHSYAEQLLPLQNFITAMFNLVIDAHRKAIYGLTFYDPTIVKLDQLDSEKLVAGRVPVNLRGPNADIRKAVHHINDSPDMQSAFTNIQATSSIMDEILPTSIQQVAGLDRATRFQSAAVVQGSKRRTTRIAKGIDSQALQRTRAHHYWNIMQFQEVVDIYVEEKNAFEQVNPQAFRDLKIQFDISDGMKGVDKLMLSEALKEVINMILQSQLGQQQIDTVKMMDHFMSLLGDKTDFSQFKFPTPFDALPPDQKQLAFDLLKQFAQQQQAAGGATGGTTGGNGATAPPAGA